MQTITKEAEMLENLYKNNYKHSMRDVVNMWRNFALNDEAGTVICSYPEGAKLPSIPIPYCEETMTGFEYALSTLMIFEGKRDYGEKMVKAVSDSIEGVDACLLVVEPEGELKEAELERIINREIERSTEKDALFFFDYLKEVDPDCLVTVVDFHI